MFSVGEVGERVLGVDILRESKRKRERERERKRENRVPKSKVKKQ